MIKFAMPLVLTLLLIASSALAEDSCRYSPIAVQTTYDEFADQSVRMAQLCVPNAKDDVARSIAFRPATIWPGRKCCGKKSVAMLFLILSREGSCLRA